MATERARLVSEVLLAKTAIKDLNKSILAEAAVNKRLGTKSPVGFATKRRQQAKQRLDTHQNRLDAFDKEAMSGEDFISREKSTPTKKEMLLKENRKLTVLDLKEAFPNINFRNISGSITVGPFGVQQKFASQFNASGFLQSSRGIDAQVRSVLRNLEPSLKIFDKTGTLGTTQTGLERRNVGSSRRGL